MASIPPLSDPVAGASPATLRLVTPELYLLFAPLFSLWDGVSMLSLSRLWGFLIGLALLYAAGRLSLALIRRRFRWRRELALLLLSASLLVAFIFLGAIWHRPMLSLAGVSPEDRVVDFHTHTNASHDVAGTLMKNFDAEANRRWHSRAGFDAAFITDHNVASNQSPVSSRLPGGTGGTVLCPGIEVSAWRAHIVLLGDTLPVDRTRYNGSLEELLDLLGALSLASLPEYRRNHWNRLDTLVAAGLDGFEIVNAAPKANELTRGDRDRVIALARAHDKFVAGVTDSHGWGATNMVWNLVRAPAGPDGPALCGVVLQQLRQGFTAVRVIERHRLRADSGWPRWLTPLGVVWETWRSMGWAQTATWIAWIWLGGFLLRRRSMRGNIA